MGRTMLANKIADTVDLNAELLPNQSLIEIYGDSRVLIECHRGLLRYSNTEVVVSLKRGFSVISGANLTVAMMNKSRIVICGSIGNVELKKEFIK